jgi:HAD superfamily hydrolase (TIGR01549 family)
VTRGEIRPITTILCDLDGTLVDSQQDIAMAFQHAWQTVVGGTPPSAARIARHIGKPLDEMLGELGGVLSPKLLNTFVTVYRCTYAMRDARLAQAYPGVLATLKALSHFQLGIVTTKEQGQAEIVLRRLTLISFFQHIQGGTPGLRLKPAADPVLAALAALDSAPAHSLVVGDTPADILAGKAAGTATCAVTYGFGTREALLPCEPDHVIDSFSELIDLVCKSRS